MDFCFAEAGFPPKTIPISREKGNEGEGEKEKEYEYENILEANKQSDVIEKI